METLKGNFSQKTMIVLDCKNYQELTLINNPYFDAIDCEFVSVKNLTTPLEKFSRNVSFRTLNTTSYTWIKTNTNVLISRFSTSQNTLCGIPPNR